MKLFYRGKERNCETSVILKHDLQKKRFEAILQASKTKIHFLRKNIPENFTNKPLAGLEYRRE